MGRHIPTDIKDPFDDLPPGVYLGTCAGLEEAWIDTDQGQIFAFKGQFRVSEPKDFASRIQFETFWIGDAGDSAKGIEPDLAAERDETWKRRAGTLKKMCAAAGVTFEGSDTDTVCRELAGKPLMWKIEHRAGTGKHVGKTFVNVKDWYRPGEARPEVHQAPTGHGGNTAPAAPPRAPAPVQPPGPPGQGAGVASPPPAAPPAYPQQNPGQYQPPAAPAMAPPPFQAPPTW